MKRMLINATHEEELRVAIVDGQRLLDIDIEHKQREQKKSNIYKAVITRVEPSLEAAFVDYGAERHGFLPFKEIAREFIKDSKKNDGGRPNVKDGIKEGQEIVVQVEKEERSNKGAALTTFISLAGRFLVLMPNNSRAGGVSRRIEGDERSELKNAMAGLVTPDGMGTIARTAGVGRTTEELQWDLDYQAEIWGAIETAAADRKAPFLIYQESNIIVRALRDYFRSDIGEIIVDEQATFDQASGFLKMYMPQNIRKLKLHTDDVPLFNRYQIESQIESAFNREVRLPSGGALVIDHTEALVSIDINSARATKGSDIEETAANTNLEAADEIARQLRLRDLGGLVVIDFIDMLANKNQRAVENRLRDALKHDRARVQIGRISRFGLLEMSRQRLRPSLGETSDDVCPRCHGSGTIRSVESTALSILRLLEEEAIKENTGQVLADVPVDIATYLLNEKRVNLNDIETRNEVTILIVANTTLETPNYSLQRVRSSEDQHDVNHKKSYELPTETSESYTPSNSMENRTKPEVAAVSTVIPDVPAPVPTVTSAAVESGGGLKKIIGKVTSLFGAKGEEETAAETAATAEKSTQGPSNKSNQNRNNSNNRDNQSRRRGGRQSQKGDKRRGGNNDARGDKRSAQSSDKNDSQNDQENRGGRGRGRGRGGNRNQNRNDKRQQNSQTQESAEQTDENASPKSARDDKANNDRPNSRRNNRNQRGRKRDAKESTTEEASKAQESSATENTQPAGQSDATGHDGDNRKAKDGSARNSDALEKTASIAAGGASVEAATSSITDDNMGNRAPAQSSASDEYSSVDEVNGNTLDQSNENNPVADEQATRRRRGPGRRRQRVDKKRQASTDTDGPQSSTENERLTDSNAQLREQGSQTASSDSKPDSRSTANGRTSNQDTTSNQAASADNKNLSDKPTQESDSPKANGTTAKSASLDDQPASEKISSKPVKAAEKPTKSPDRARTSNHSAEIDKTSSSVSNAGQSNGSKAANSDSFTSDADRSSARSANAKDKVSTVDNKPSTGSDSTAGKAVASSVAATGGAAEASATSDKGSDSENGSRVSQRQPSQLKSSVRSLASKESGSMSFASRKVSDVDKEANATEKSSD
ncbi:MAG: Rne/Rng family ribonuclease [Gammaproteobacteria bacterium]|nr:Rne/Rng family ribonuclease [Gammaproteobacteria bacterium]